MTSHTKKWKEIQLAEIKELADKYPVVAVASLTNFPGALAKELRKKLNGKAVIKVSKTRVITKALADSNKEVKGLDEHMKGSVAVIFSEMNPFELYAVLKRNSVNMPAKAGMESPDNVTIPAGDTGLPPGPALSDLKAAGLKTVMQGPTISIAEDKVVAKKGDIITEGVAGALSKLGIKPIKVRLNILASLENGQVYLGNVLNIDVNQVRQDFANASRTAFNIAVEVAYCTVDTMPALITKGFKNAKAVAIEANMLTSATVQDVLAKANAQATVLKAKIPETVEEASEEKPAEETKEEEKPTEEAPAEEKNTKPAEEEAEKKE